MIGMECLRFVSPQSGAQPHRLGPAAMRRLFTYAICLAAALALAGCTMGRVNSRVAYWQKQTEIYIPVGTSLDDAQRFLASQGLQLRCCMSGPDIHDAYSASERDVGRFVFTEYSVLIVADVSANQTIDRVRVFRIGVGL
jgi:hypothetical protein